MNDKISLLPRVTILVLAAASLSCGGVLADGANAQSIVHSMAIVPDPTLTPEPCERPTRGRYARMGRQGSAIGRASAMTGSWLNTGCRPAPILTTKLTI
jgi:hypothetical protein